MNYAMQAFGVYKETEQASAMKSRDYKDATDLIIRGGGVRRRYGFNSKKINRS